MNNFDFAKKLNAIRYIEKDAKLIRSLISYFYAFDNKIKTNTSDSI